MATTIRTYLNGVCADVTGQSVADTGPFSISVPTTGWTPGTYSVAITAQKSGEAESPLSTTLPLTVNGATSVTLDSNISVAGHVAGGATNADSYYGSTYGAHTFGLTNVSSLPTQAFNVSAAGKTLLVIADAWNNNSQSAIASGCTGGGVTWTLIHSEVESTGHAVSVYRATSTGTMSNAVATVTWTSAPLRAAVHVVVANGVSAGTPLGGHTVGSAAGDIPLTLTVAAAGSLLLGVVHNTGEYSVAAGGTLIGDASSNGSGADAEAWLLFRRTVVTTAGEVGTSVSQTVTRTVATAGGNAAFFEIRAG